MGNDYYLGLDMGTSSVGWAATTPNYELVRAKGKDLWGVRLFDEAETAEGRRTYRTARRRRQREVARLGFLRSVFADKIEKVDEGFFVRLDESKFYLEDRSESNQQKFAIFADGDFTDKEYYQQYPTIFHLRKAMIENDGSQEFDVRLVYLAIASLYKRRGHFLNEMIDEDGVQSSLSELFDELNNKLCELEISSFCVNIAQLEEVLSEKGISKSKVLENASRLAGITKKDKAQYQMLSLICGMTVKMKDIFGEEILGEENKAVALCFRNASYEEKALEVQEIIGNDNYDVIEILKEIHDKALLANIMKGHEFLSQARVASYEEHQADLKVLKGVLKKYDMDAYNEMFRTMKAGNYSAYVGSVNSKGEKTRRINGDRSAESLYKNIKAMMQKFPQDDPDVKTIIERIETGNFLSKQLTYENGVIPNQVHLRELKKILENTERFLPFLAEKDETGLSVSEKIEQVYKFRIPYYVGPLGDVHAGEKGVNAWSKPIESGKIYPWNFEQKVNLKESRQAFIERMVRHCTYLSGSKALPKNSYLYEKFELLNELNNLKIRGEKISVELKQEIYQDLFSRGKKVSLKALYNYLVRRHVISEAEIDAISGIDGGFKSSLTTVGKFYGIFGDEVHSDKNRVIIEDIVFLGALFGQEKKLLVETIKEKYASVLSEKDIKKISGFKFEGWGKLSREFLMLEGASKEDGVVRSLIGGLWETNDNLMELLSSRYTYTDSLKEMVATVEKPLQEWTIDDLDDKYLSAPVKRMVWQTLSIIREIEDELGCPPKRVFVEMAREEGEKKRTISRKQRLLDLYKSIGKEANDWRKEVEARDEAEFNSRKLFLYYTQMGRCMYTGKSIDLDDLMVANGKYDIDHIYPRHFVKDDSLENNLVLVCKDSNAYKSDNYPIDSDTRNNQQIKDLWAFLKNKKLISDEKYHRLVRSTPFTAEEKAAFVNRQLVETRQGTKAITEILSQAFKDTDIVFSKAGVVSDFRQKQAFYKARSVNHLHHAHDAYLNIVVGNAYFVKFTKNPVVFMREAELYANKEEYKYHMDKMFKWNVCRNGELAWDANSETGTIKIVTKVLAKASPIVTRMAVENHGAITQKATIWNKNKAKGEGYVSVKMNDPRLQDVTKYGGLSDVATSGYALIEYTKNGKLIKSIEQIPVYLGRVNELKTETLRKYFVAQLSKEATIEDLRICRKFIPINSMIKFNGFYYYLGGKTGTRIILKSATELCLEQEMLTYVKKIEKAIATGNYQEKDNEKKLIITKDRNVELYHILKDKYTNTIFRNEVGSVKKIVVENEGKFVDLDLEKQCYVLGQIILHLCEGVAVDLTDIGGAKISGKMRMSQNISSADELILITQSSSGIHRADINLLAL